MEVQISLKVLSVVLLLFPLETRITNTHMLILLIRINYIHIEFDSNKLQINVLVRFQIHANQWFWFDPIPL